MARRTRRNDVDLTTIGTNARRLRARCGLSQRGLAEVPIIDWRAYTDLEGDIHDSYRSYTVRERLREANGHADNHVMWVGNPPDMAERALAVGVASTITALIGSGERQVLLDLSTVTYVDSATIGCLMDLYRQATAAGGSLTLTGVQKRVETTLTMTGAQNFLELHADAPSAIKSFGG